MDSIIVFASIAIISSLIHPLSSKSSAVVFQLADYLSVVHTSQSGSI